MSPQSPLFCLDFTSYSCPCSTSIFAPPVSRHLSYRKLLNRFCDERMYMYIHVHSGRPRCSARGRLRKSPVSHSLSSLDVSGGRAIQPCTHSGLLHLVYNAAQSSTVSNEPTTHRRQHYCRLSDPRRPSAVAPLTALATAIENYAVPYRSSEYRHQDSKDCFCICLYRVAA